jgi:hypothetical protein
MRPTLSKEFTMNRIKKTLSATKTYVADHRVVLSVTVTAAACLYLNHLALKDHDEFLKEKGLLEEFYTPED